MSMRGRWAAPATLVAALALVAAGCGGGDKEASATESTVTITEATETTSTEQETAEATTEETTEETTGAASGLADKDCLELASIGAKFSQALGATGSSGNLEATSKLFQALVDKAPDEIKGDLATMAKAWNEIAAALKDVDLTSAQPSPATIAKIQALSAKFDTPELKQASAHLTAWSAKHCGSGTTP